MKLIIWVNHQLGKSQKVLDTLKQLGFTGLIINVAEYDKEKYLPEYDLITRANLHDFPDSILSLGTGMWRERQKLYPEIKKYYLGESKCSVYKGESAFFTNDVQAQFNTNGSQNYVCDEPSLLRLPEYKQYNCNVSYSSYRRYWLWVEKLFWFFKLQVRIPRFGNQIWAWKWLENKYGLEREGFFRACDGVIKSRFNFCWINLQLNKNDFPELIQWCKQHQKTIMVYSEWNVGEKEFLKQINEFTTIKKQIEGK